MEIGGPTHANASFTATFTFNEAVSGFELSDIAVGNGTASALTETTLGTVWTARITPGTEGAVTLDVPAGAAQDAAGNDSTAATRLRVTYDVSALTVEITGPITPQNAAFEATFTFSAAVSGFALSDINVGNGTASNLRETTTGTVWTVLITPAGDGAVTIDVPAGAARDDDGNDSTAPARFSVLYDGTAPTVEIGGPTTPQNAPFEATFTFSTAVSGFELSDIVVGNGEASNLRETTTGTVWTATVTPAGDGAVTLDVAADVARDQAGNGNIAAAQLSVLYDASAPSAVTITAARGDGAVTLSWTDPADSTITGWEVRRDGGAWQAIDSSDASTTSHTVSQLTNGQSYAFEIRAVNPSGNGVVSNQASATPAGLPLAPTGFRATGCQSACKIDPLSACNIDPLSGTAEVVPVADRGDPRGFV